MKQVEDNTLIVSKRDFEEKSRKLLEGLNALDEVLNDFERMTIFSEMMDKSYLQEITTDIPEIQKLQNIYYKFDSDLQDLYKKLMKHNEKVYNSYSELKNLFRRDISIKPGVKMKTQ